MANGGGSSVPVGLVTYPTAEAKAIREAGVYILHSDNIELDFPELATAAPNEWGGEGPADFLFEVTSYTPSPGAGDVLAGRSILQRLSAGNGFGTNNAISPAYRTFNYLPGDPESTVPFILEPYLPRPSDGYIAIGSGGKWISVSPAASALPNSVMKRSATGTTMVADPVNFTDAANKRYVDGTAGKYVGIMQWQGVAFNPDASMQGFLVPLMHADPTVVNLYPTGFPAGYQIDVVRFGGPVTFQAASDAVVHGTSLSLRAPYSVATAIKLLNNEWLVVGDVA